jgi:long-chain acyl-CoA synthetase
MSTILTSKPGFYGVGSVEISPPLDPGESGVRRLANCKDVLIKQPMDGIETTYDILSHAARTHGSNNAFGWRDIVNIIQEEKNVTKVVDGKEIAEKKTWQYFELSDYKYMSYVEVKTDPVSTPVIPTHSPNSFSPNWQLMPPGCGSVSVTLGTAYDTLG